MPLVQGQTGLLASPRCVTRWYLAVLLALLFGASTRLWAADDPAASSAAQRTDQTVIESINRHIRQGWSDAELAPSPQAVDGEWCRRVFLDLIGRIPTVEETTRFVRAKGDRKRADLVERLVDSDEYAEEFAKNWTNVWTNLLVGRPVGDGRRSLVNRDGMQQYLRRSLLANKPYDRLVYELISADGVNTPGEDAYNGAVNFLIDNLEDKGVQATAKTARLFLGLQVQCTQCHNHPFNNWKQNQFWELNAFFRQSVALRSFDGQEIVKAQLADQDFAGDGGNPRDAEIYYEERRGTAVIAYPKFVDGTELSNHSGYVEDVNRRDELAKLVVASPALAEAAVNRMWGHFFSVGFTKPVDDMGPHNPPSHPELLAELAADFRAHGYDLRRLMRWLALSEPYSLTSSSVEKNEEDDPSLGEAPKFSHFYLRQMTAEQLYESLVSAMQADQAVQGTAEEQESRRRTWLAQFTTAFGTDEGGESSTFNGTIPQALMLMNGDLVRQAASDGPGSFLDRLLASPDKDAGKLNHLYLAALSRLPNKQEQARAKLLWDNHGGDTKAALADVWWALLNCNEFILNH